MPFSNTSVCFVLDLKIARQHACLYNNIDESIGLISPQVSFFVCPPFCPTCMQSCRLAPSPTATTSSEFPEQGDFSWTQKYEVPLLTARTCPGFHPIDATLDYGVWSIERRNNKLSGRGITTLLQ